MGIKSESVSDTSLARPHAAGTKVRVLQHAEHRRFGSIAYERRRLWTLHHLMAVSGRRQLGQVHEAVLRCPVESSQARFLSADMRPDLTLHAYHAGTQMILNVVLTMQHFCEELERVLGLTLRGGSISARISEAFGGAGIQVGAQEKGYAAFVEIVERRDAIEHPKKGNVHNSHPTD